MNKPQGTYRVQLNLQGGTWFALDDQGDWRANCFASKCKGQAGMDLVSSLFHADEIESVEVIDDVTFASIYYF